MFCSPKTKRPLIFLRLFVFSGQTTNKQPEKNPSPLKILNRLKCCEFNWNGSFNNDGPDIRTILVEFN
jgi:hypothetical protein